ncbi:hypothetical protein MTZ49_04715 [Entomomonas sp. E2T0]|uniref:hypothetical protein n=1 Tax=Entomomonas sp. E2T0 TaxID=2930213 RepID=UPI0022282892|nr:hypothetical protein [Entomomonas sp. E2T0]UYZ84873.1 hypothetical protein MTZ49_04715 [Entomomonas sp. E2T0]
MIDKKMSGEKDSENFYINPSIILWGLLAFIFSVYFCCFSDRSVELGYGFFAKVFGVTLGTFLGLLGALIGNVLRKFVQPDSFYTTGGFMQLLWLRIFWLCGPQFIGLLIGFLVGVAIPAL